MSETFATTDVEALANESADSIDPDETIELLQDLVQIWSPYFEEEEAAEFVDTSPPPVGLSSSVVTHPYPTPWLRATSISPRRWR